MKLLLTWMSPTGKTTLTGISTTFDLGDENEEILINAFPGLSGETVTNTARKLNLKSCNVANVRNVFEFKCELVFPNAKRLKDKKYNSKIKEVDLKTNDDVVKLITINEAVNSKTIKEYIRETLNISKKKTDKLFRESMEIYCKGSVI